MKSQIAAFMERALPRGFSALLTLLLAALTNPKLVGIYGFVTLMYTALQAATDTAARQVLMRVVRETSDRHPDEEAGARFVRWYLAIVPAFSFLMISGLTVVLKWQDIIPSWRMVLELAPMALAPTATAWGLHAAGILQACSRWTVMARAQLWASLVSVVVVLPILYSTRDLFGPALQTLLAEGIVAFLCIRAARGVVIKTVEAAAGARTIGGEMVSMSTFAFLAWTQGQAERVLIGGLAGPAQLGIYGTASSVARAPGDALAASTANIVRAELALVSEPSEIRRVADRVLGKALILAAAGWASAILLSLALRPLMGSQWYPALNIVPILAISAFPAVLTWSAATILLRAGRAWHTLWAPIAGIVMAIVIAWAATRSLMVASYLVVLRDLVTVTLAFILIPKSAPWRAYGLCCGIVAVLAVATFIVLR